MKTFDLNTILRANIRALVPYASARSEYKGQAGVLLDANENTSGSPLDYDYSRYPDPLQQKLKERIANMKGLLPEQIFIGNGSDEAIDLLIRAFCRPGLDEILICPPTYGMYEVCACINDVAVKKISLIAETFQLDIETIQQAVNKNTKLLFVCCPNNPTGNGVKWKDIRELVAGFNGIVVLDEAYIDFASYRSLVDELQNYPNLVILQTFSKAWGLAGLRVGMAFASPAIIAVLNKIKFPYNIGSLTQQLTLEALEKKETVMEMVEDIKRNRDQLKEQLESFSFVQKVYPSEANFLLVKMKRAKDVYTYLLSAGIIVRDRSTTPLCEDCLRITVGTTEENKYLLKTLQTWQP